MRNYFIFLKKELFEAAKTYKLLIMGAVFLLFGMASPLTARFMPEIIRWAMESEPSMAGMDLSGLITQPVALDSWAQFFGGYTGQMGLVVLVIVFSGMLSSELSKGTLTIMLSKGLSRSTVIFSKLTGALLIWTASYAIAFLTAWGYTTFMFPGESVPNLFLAMFCLWGAGVFLLALITLMATKTNKGSACLLLTGAVVIMLAIINVIPKVSKYNPLSLISSPAQLLYGTTTPRHVYPVLVVAGIAIAAFTMLAVIFFNKRKAGKKTALLACAAALCFALTIFIYEEIPQQIKLGRLIISERIIVGEGTEWELHGLLTLPKNVQDRVPALVLVHGSGSHDMDETIFENKPFRDIAEYLSSNGIAVIRYNMRTLTHWNNMPEYFTVWEEKIEDAILAAEMLKSDPRIDENRVYMLGHSYGGVLAPRIHVMGGNFAGIILFASSPRFLIDISKAQNYAAIEVMEDDSEKEAALAFMDEQWDDHWNSFLYLPDDEAKTTLVPGWGGATAWYFKDLYLNPPEMFIKNITVPFLVMQPDDDVQVLTGIDFAMYKELLAGRTNVTFKLYEGLNHLFMPSTGRDISQIFEEYRIKANVDPQVLMDIAEWIKSDK
ncbi:MAG: alpha/beta fold hydrolase [Treponema sp.]|jgi:ABC-type transport system involved in multi-copper enzyme maturation permease subunit/dienelactone hydrolase|nr:alpha/beta fold hydrolase [Treponema sp.]